ncbi:MAG: PEP-CTERM sorting domain-containing protein [Planctomycetes bacterium]|nr:PEP-CTERM sorting domain-containing protein [Planctomycetota bacterium]MCB9889906.1 PEP-CTERM sorting domain-containing protein [Planctomycetota bacterium]
MPLPRLTGQTFSFALAAILGVANLPLTALAQSRTEIQDSAAADTGAGAHPAPEPDTWMLLATGAVILLVLYTRRRARVGVAQPVES